MKLSKAEEVFDNIVGKRFQTSDDIEKWIREFTGQKLKGLCVGELYSINENEDDGYDDCMDCTFGEKQCGMDYADFTLFAIKTNADEMYITEACWSY